jgi:hypothetical protein
MTREFDRLVSSVKSTMIADLKHKYRSVKKRYATINKLKALPRIQNVFVRNNYVNPVTLNAIPYGPTVYHVKDPRTGRVDYYDKATFWRLMHQGAPNIKNNYNLLMADPKRGLFKNPVTRSNIKTRNIIRVRVKPAAKKIQSAVRKHLAKKPKTPSRSK